MSSFTTGQTIAWLHNGAWRADAPDLELSSRQLKSIMPSLFKTGSVGIVWPRLRHAADRYGALGIGMEQGYAAQVEHNGKVATEIAGLVTEMRRAGIEPVLIKGWSNSRLYPQGVIRPAGDIDLWVRAADYERASSVIAGLAESGHSIGVDLHDNAHWKDPDPVDLHTGSASFELEGVQVSVPCPEDHLRLSCLHFLVHEGRRPIWLCDIALVLESRPSDFDWDRFLGKDSLRRNWIVATLGLAHQLLGARIDDTPIFEEAQNVPAWFAPSVLKQWEAGERKHAYSTAASEVLQNPAAIGTTLRRRWPDPVRASVQCNRPFDDTPRLPIQVAAYTGLLAQYGIRRLLPQVVQYFRLSR